MTISLHRLAHTTPTIRREIAISTASIADLARRYHITEMTVRQWQGRTEFHDRSQTAHRLQTTLTPTQEAVVVSLRKALRLPLDNLLAVVREFLCPPGLSFRIVSLSAPSWREQVERLTATH